MSNLRPTSASAKQSILHFISGMVPNSVSRAISIILSPCCNITATGGAACTDKVGVYSVTITLSAPINLAGQGYAFLVVEGLPAIPVPDGTTVLNFPEVSGSPGDRTFSLILVMTDPTAGHVPITPGMSSAIVGYTIPSISIVFPTC